VPLGKLSVRLSPESAAAVNAPVPILVATAVGVPFVKATVTVVELLPPPEPPEPPLLPEPPHPAINMNTPLSTDKRIIPRDMVISFRDLFGKILR
jgi:hypothetical protein